MDTAPPRPVKAAKHVRHTSDRTTISGDSPEVKSSAPLAKGAAAINTRCRSSTDDEQAAAVSSQAPAVNYTCHLPNGSKGADMRTVPPKAPRVKKLQAALSAPRKTAGEKRREERRAMEARIAANKANVRNHSSPYGDALLTLM